MKEVDDDRTIVQTDIVPKKVFVFIFLLILVIIYAGYWFYKAESDQIISQKESTLTSIATLKADRLSDWYLDELFDAEVITNNPALMESVFQYQQNGATADSSRLVMILNQIKVEHDYADIFLTTMDGQIMIGTSPEINRIEPAEYLHIGKAVHEDGSVSTDLFRTERDGDHKILISFISVIEDENGYPMYAMVFRFNADQFLYPLIESWPISSRTAESYIFKVDGDSILYLNNLRHLKDAALHFRLPVSRPGLPAAEAASGFTGVINGIDYHDERVISYVTYIENTPWFLVSKIEERELFEDVSGIFWSIMGLVILGILFSTVSIGLIYNHRQKSFYRELYGKEKELWQEMEKFKVTMDNLGEGVIITDLSANIQYMNVQAEELTGWKNSEAKGRLLGEIYSVRNEKTGEHENNILEKVIKQGLVKELANHTLLIKKNGDKIPVMDTGAPVFDPEGNLNGIVITFQDETEKRNRQKILKESEEKLQKLLMAIEQSPSSIIITNVNGDIEYVNPAFTSITGYSKETVLGKNPRILNSGVQSKEFFKNLWETISSGNIWQGEICNKKKNGELFWELASISPVKNSDGVITNYIAVKEDITERKMTENQIRENEKYLESLFKSVPDTIIVLNNKGEILHFNPSSVDYPPGTDKILRSQLSKLLPEKIKKLQNGISTNGERDKPVAKFQFELKYEQYNYHFSARAVPFGEDKVIVTLSDITETIQNFNRINSLLRIEEEQSKRLQNFTHIVSHNLRSHTANMEGLFDVLSMDEPKMFENPYIKLIKESSSNLQDTIRHLNQILDINITDKKDWKSVDLNLAVNRTISIISNQTEKGQVMIHNLIPEETMVDVIPAYLESILLNLIANAVKFRSEERDSYVKITTQTEDDYRVIFVEDNGLGIDLKRHQDKLFGMYKTFHEKNDSRGLGLFMTKSQIEAMGGKIEVESEVEKGSTFKVYLHDEKD